MKRLTIRQRPFDGILFPGAEHLHPVLARIYAGRNITHIEQTEYSLKNLLPPDTLKGINQAVEVLHHALANQERILVIGDFDVDGATSTTVAVKVLTALGAKNVSYLVPDRFKYGYGLTPEIVEAALEYTPDVIVTVDNGIASIDGVNAAHAHGLKVLITDHHLPGAELPKAEAIVNPNQPGDTFASKSLAGVGVIFYLMMALRAFLREQSWFEQQNIPEPNLTAWLDLVALGTVADMVPLDYNNRILVSQGLARIQARQCQPGILALLELANKQAHQLSATDLGFVVAPRLNAAGRLDDMSVGIECLLSPSVQQARGYAAQLESLNQERKEIQADMQEQAAVAVQNMNTDGNELPQGICLFQEDWHQGVIGLIASKVKEKLNRPVIAFAKGEAEDIKGSARSVTGINIRDVLDAVATANPGLLIKFGGHAMAAGLSIHRNRIDDFSKAFAAEIERLGHNGNDPEAVYTDGELTDDDLSLEIAEALKRAGPWGQGFPEPLFEGSFEVVEQRIVGQRHLKLVLSRKENQQLDAIAFNVIKNNEEPELEQIWATYRFDVNEFRGQRKAQLILDYFQAD